LLNSASACCWTSQATGLLAAVEHGSLSPDTCYVLCLTAHILRHYLSTPSPHTLNRPPSRVPTLADTRRRRLGGGCSALVRAEGHRASKLGPLNPTSASKQRLMKWRQTPVLELNNMFRTPLSLPVEVGEMATSTCT
jgi:hypothetical protein